MKTIEVDDDTWALLQLEARHDAADLAACIRRLINSPKNKGNIGHRKRIRAADVVVPDELTPEHLPVLYPKAIFRFLCLLGWLSRQHPDAFHLVENVRGRDRTYFSTEPADILAGGNSTAPVRIPGCPYWVCSNISNVLKERILDDAMTLLGYRFAERRTWIDAVIGDKDQPRPRSAPDGDDPTDDDPIRI